MRRTDNIGGMPAFHREPMDISLDSLLAVAERTWYVGIDGGGTKTEFVLCDDRGAVHDRIVAEGSNPNSLGLEKSYDVLCAGLDRLLDGRRIQQVFAGVSGVTVGDFRTMLANRLTERYHTPVAVNTDAVNLLACARNGEISGAVICGTGSCVFVREHGNLHRFGGWGYLFDEAGSAYHIGRDAVRHALMVGDGFAPPDLLYRRMTQALGGNPFEQLKHVDEQGSAAIASFARIVTDAAQQGDPSALAILERNAGYIAKLLRAATGRYGGDIEFIADGGLMRHEPFRRMISQRAGVALRLQELPPVFGACIEALRLSGTEPTDAWRNHFRDTYRRQTC